MNVTLFSSLDRIPRSSFPSTLTTYSPSILPLLFPPCVAAFKNYDRLLRAAPDLVSEDFLTEDIMRTFERAKPAGMRGLSFDAFLYSLRLVAAAR
jgi:hypothetical protein